LKGDFSGDYQTFKLGLKKNDPRRGRIFN